MWRSSGKRYHLGASRINVRFESGQNFRVQYLLFTEKTSSGLINK